MTAGPTVLEDVEAADALVAVLAANGVEALFAMPGDAFPVLEAIARRQDAGEPAPRIVTCLHEIVALSAAHGHHMVSGRPQACLLHVDVGLQMAGGMLHNAHRGRAGVVILAGRTPVTTDGSLRGGRVVDVHWMQDRLDQAGAVRDYVKWHYDVARTEILAEVVQRACRIAAAEPPGPVYVGLLREMLMERIGRAELPPPARFGTPRATVPAPEALAEAADVLAAARRPLIVTGQVGRTAAGFHALTEFAERLAIPVISRGGRANASTESPMYLGADPGPHLGDADVLLLLDVDVPYVPLFGAPGADCRVVQIDADPLKEDMGLWGFPVDVVLAGSTAAALPLLAPLVEERRDAAARARAEERRAEIAAAHDAWRQRLAGAEALADAAPIDPAYLARCVAELVDDHTIVVDDCTTALRVTSEHVPTRVPGSYFQPVGSSMGWGSGAALGAKLAAPEKTVINLNAEGNLVSGVPEAALWTAARHDAPYLIVVFDNASYAAIKLGLLHEYPDSALARAGTALDLERPPDLVKIAESAGAHGERVEDPRELRAALRRGLDAVRAGRPALVDVAVAGP